ncbi:hypothetical protein ACFL1B_01750 [Nanoarchaeota archaeon]
MSDIEPIKPKPFDPDSKDVMSTIEGEGKGCASLHHRLYEDPSLSSQNVVFDLEGQTEVSMLVYVGTAQAIDIGVGQLHFVQELVSLAREKGMLIPKSYSSGMHGSAEEFYSLEELAGKHPQLARLAKAELDDDPLQYAQVLKTVAREGSLVQRLIEYGIPHVTRVMQQGETHEMDYIGASLYGLVDPIPEAPPTVEE